MSYEAANRAFFRQHDPDLLRELENVDHTRAQVMPARRQGDTLSFDGKFVHSKYDPLKEAKAAVKGEPASCHIHLGFGLGYFLEADNSPEDGAVVILEPNRELVLAAFRYRDLRPLFRGRRVFLCCSAPRFKDLLHRGVRGEEAVKIVESPYHVRIYPNLSDQIAGAVKEAQFNSELAIRTILKHTPMLTEGALRALPFTTRLPGVERLSGAFRGHPAVLVSPGPSLEKNLADLEPYRDQCLIFCGARGVEPLARRDLSPDFMVHNETQSYFFLIERAHNLGQTTFLLSEQAQTDFFTFPHGHTFVYNSATNLVSKWIQAHYPTLDKHALETGGSVATEALSLAYLFGCDPILFLGQDLSVSGDKYYAGSSNQRFAHNESSFRDIGGYFGGKVRTLTTYLSFLIWFQDKIGQFHATGSRPQVINATEGGVRMQGVPRALSREVAYFHFRQNIDSASIISRLAHPGTAPTVEPLELVRFLQATRTRLEQIVVLCTRFAPFVQDFRKELKRLSPRNLTKVQKMMTSLDNYNQQYQDLQKDMQVLSGFLQAELHALRREGKGQTTADDEIRRLAVEIEADLHRSSITFTATLKAAKTLDAILVEVGADLRRAVNHA